MKRIPAPVVKTRDELIYLLCEASEIEHQLLLIYLFAAFSLKHNMDEGGIEEDQLEKVRSWKKRITGIAVEEMLHLAMVSNMLTAVGSAPHLRRPNLPLHNARYYPKGFKMDLLPFGEKSLKRFVAYEHPSNQKFHPEEFQIAGSLSEDSGKGSIYQVVPEEIPYKTIHDLYSSILNGFKRLSSGLGGEKALFIVPPHAQLHSAKGLQLFDELKLISSVKDVEKSVEVILEQGEGNLGLNTEGHYQKFIELLNEYALMQKQSAEKGFAFNPVRNVLGNPFTHQPVDSNKVCIIEDEFTREVSSLFNAVYETTLEIMLRTFAHTGESPEEVATLGNTFIGLMHSVIAPLGELLTQLPAGKSHLNKTAGPAFECYGNTHFLPHKNAAWIIFSELLNEESNCAKYLADKTENVVAKNILTTTVTQLESFRNGLGKSIII